MKTPRDFRSVLAALASAVTISFLAGCGDDKAGSDPPDEPASKETARTAANSPAPPTSSAPAPSAAEIDAELDALMATDSEFGKTRFSPKIEARIDAIIGDHTDVRELMQNAEFQRIMQEMTKDWRPGPEIQKRLNSAMQLLITSKFPGEDRTRPGAGFQLLPSDIGIIHEAVGHALIGDPDKFFSSFVNFAEEAALQTALDPDSNTGIKVERRDPAELEAHMERARRAADEARRAAEQAR